MGSEMCIRDRQYICQLICLLPYAAIGSYQATYFNACFTDTHPERGSGVYANRIALQKLLQVSRIHQRQNRLLNDSLNCPWVTQSDDYVNAAVSTATPLDQSGLRNYNSAPSNRCLSRCIFCTQRMHLKRRRHAENRLSHRHDSPDPEIFDRY